MPFMRRNIPSPQREINDLEPPACFYYALKSVNLTVPPALRGRRLTSDYGSKSSIQVIFSSQ